jgi:hypothetical protein
MASLQKLRGNRGDGSNIIETYDAALRGLENKLKALNSPVELTMQKVTNSASNGSPTPCFLNFKVVTDKIREADRAKQKMIMFLCTEAESLKENVVRRIHNIFGTGLTSDGAMLSVFCAFVSSKFLGKKFGASGLLYYLRTVGTQKEESAAALSLSNAAFLDEATQQNPNVAGRAKAVAYIGEELARLSGNKFPSPNFHAATLSAEGKEVPVNKAQIVAMTSAGEISLFDWLKDPNNVIDEDISETVNWVQVDHFIIGQLDGHMLNIMMGKNAAGKWEARSIDAGLTFPVINFSGDRDHMLLNTFAMICRKYPNATLEFCLKKSLILMARIFPNLPQLSWARLNCLVEFTEKAHVKKVAKVLHREFKLHPSEVEAFRQRMTILRRQVFARIEDLNKTGQNPQKIPGSMLNAYSQAVRRAVPNRA